MSIFSGMQALYYFLGIAMNQICKELHDFKTGTSASSIDQADSIRPRQ